MKTRTLLFHLCGWLVIANASLAQDLKTRNFHLRGQASSPPRDADGFPLPAGAVARLGTLRWRTTEYVTSLAFSRDGKRLLADRHSVRLWELTREKSLRCRRPVDKRSSITTEVGSC